MMNPSQAIQELTSAGFSEARIAELVVSRTGRCSQATIHRIKNGRQRCSWELGNAILEIYAEYQQAEAEEAA